MNVLSLFDGMSCGRIALERAGIPVTTYFASEVDKYAIQISKKNWPDIVQLGDVRYVEDFLLPEIDLLIGGSPCQGFSFAGKGLNFDDERSKLFFEFVRLLEECKPKYFLLENVKMKKEHQHVISKYLGVEPIEINSALVSAQNRRRLYWTNILGVGQPEDKGIFLKDILEEYPDEKYHISATMQRNLENWEQRNLENFRLDEGLRIREGGKTGTLSARARNDENCVQLVYLKNYAQYDLNGLGHGSQDQRAFYPDGKAGTVTTNSISTQKVLENYRIRRLTPVECERLQTVPDNYTEGVSDTQRYKMLGNGWTVDVIAHIFKGLK